MLMGEKGRSTLTDIHNNNLVLACLAGQCKTLTRFELLDKSADGLR